ncbi:MAG: NAD-glutamate dehydrogenase, partial [Actinomycetes bacterium]
MSADVRDGLTEPDADPQPFEGLDESKATLLARVAASSGDGAAGDVAATAAFLRRYYRHVATDDLVARRDKDIAAAALSHRELAAMRPQGTATVRVWTPSEERDGWSASGHSVVEVVSDDMPFLVDSVTAELSRHGRAIHLVVHPQLVVRRDVTGALIEVLDASVPVSPTGGDLVESWMHIEVDRGTDGAGDDMLTADLERVLRDVREAVEDWPKMRAVALRIADEITAA